MNAVRTRGNVLTAIAGLFLLCFQWQAYADTSLELFTRHDLDVSGLDQVRNSGHKVHTIYMDSVDRIEQALSERATQMLQAQIQHIQDRIGLKQLVNMSDFERNQLLRKELEKTGMDVESIRLQLITPTEREAMMNALSDLIYAQQQGITNEQLPAVIYQGKVYARVQDISLVLDDHGK